MNGTTVRRLGGVLVVCLLLALHGLGAAQTETGAGLFRGDSERTANYSVSGLRGEPDVVWERRLPSENNLTGPILREDLLFVANGDGQLYALNAATGEDVWKFGAGLQAGGFAAAPAVVDGIAYVGGGEKLYALDAATGEERWSIDVPGGLFNSPAIGDGLLYFASGEGVTYAIDMADGQERWKASPHAHVIPAVALSGGMVYVSGIDPGSQPGVTSSSIVALDALTGEQRWQSRTPSISSFLAATDRRVYSGDSSGSFYALDGATGAEVWTFQGVEAGWSAPAVAGGVVYVGQSDFTGDIPNAASLDKQMFALDAATGREIWRFEADDWVSDPVVASGVVYFTTMNHAWRSGDGEHSLYALDVESGDLLWQFKADSRLLSSIVGNETAYAVAYSGPVYALGQAEEATPTAVAQPTVDGASTPTPEASSPTVVPAASLVPVAAATATSVIAPVSTPAVVGAPQAGMPRTGSDGMDGIASGAAYLALAAMLVLMGVALALRRKRKL